MKVVQHNQACALYELEGATAPNARRFIASTAGTRAIVNDPSVYGVEYTSKLSESCAAVLKALVDCEGFIGREKTTTVLNILRGGLNFDIRNALATAFEWNSHSSAFISAQRARKEPNSKDWIITENSYKKIHLGKETHLVFGDVVATGTSLEYALNRIFTDAKEHDSRVASITFLTIGGSRSHEIVERLALEHGIKCSTIYFEGVFLVADQNTPVTIKYTETDLLRRESELAPEFLESQLKNPAFPLERCTIYDAGSRAYDIVEYLEDVVDYWEMVEELAEKGMTYERYLGERFPELSAESFGDVDLGKLAKDQIKLLRGDH